jgi:hypothetical protein
MAEADWDAITDALSTAVVKRGVSTAYTVPNGGGSFIHGFRSLTTDSGLSALFVDLTNFNPVAGTKKGGSIRGCMKRYTAGTGYFPFIGLFVDKVSTASGYLIGLSDATSYKICLKKGAPTSLDETESTILRKSTAGFTDSGDTAAAWHHLRLDVLVNPHGETILSAYENDLDSYTVTSPTWAAIDGMADYTDDSLGALTGTSPHLQGFYAIFGHYTENSQGSVSLFDHMEAIRQTAP